VAKYGLWQTGARELVRKVRCEGAGNLSGNIVFAPDESFVVVIHDRSSDVKLLAVANGRELASLDTGKPLWCSPDGGLLAIAALDERSLLVWDLRSIRRYLATMKLDWELPPKLTRAGSGKTKPNTLTVRTNGSGRSLWYPRVRTRPKKSYRPQLSRHCSSCGRSRKHRASRRSSSGGWSF